MSRGTKPTRRLELLDRIRSGDPLAYDLAPKNRLQRRTLAKALRSNSERKKQGRRE